MSGLRDPGEHDDLLNYRLKRIVALGGAPAIRLCEGRYGISRFEWRMVAALVERGPMSPSELVVHSGVDGARVSLAIRSLAGKALVRRSVDRSDRRRAIVSASARGAALYADLFPRLAALNRSLVAALDDAEVAVLDRCLRKLAERARQIHAEGGNVTERAARNRGGSRRHWMTSDVTPARCATR